MVFVSKKKNLSKLMELEFDSAVVVPSHWRLEFSFFLLFSAIFAKKKQKTGAIGGQRHEKIDPTGPTIEENNAEDDDNNNNNNNNNNNTSDDDDNNQTKEAGGDVEERRWVLIG